VLALAGCALAGKPPVSAPPLGAEGQLHVYLRPLPHEASRLSFRIEAASALLEDGEAIPLTLALSEIVGAEQVAGERLLASGRLPPGKYLGLRLTLAKPRLEGQGSSTDLLLPAAPPSADLPFELRSGQAAVVEISLDAARSLAEGGRFDPHFSGAVPALTPPGLVGACVNTGTNDVTLFDLNTRRVSSVVATGQSPYGLALDVGASRAYVALGAEDRLEVIDLSRAERLAQISLRAGDEPRDLLLLPDRRTLLVVNFRSRTVSFVDGVSSVELGRADVGESPWSILLLRSGTRAVVVNRRSNSLSVLDLASRALVATVPTDPEPLFARVSRDGTRLYVVHVGSPYMIEYALPSFNVSRRILVGLGASGLQVDPRTDLVYVARGGDPRIQVFDSFSMLPVDAFAVPGWVSRMAIDGVQDQLFALMPGRRAVAVLDLTSRRLLSTIDLPGDPYEVKLASERN
jgi:YVTN family beta-propeller protein